MKQLLVDYIPFEITSQQINESLAKNGKLIVAGVLQRADSEKKNGRIYRYEITSNWNHGEWNPDSESIEDFLINQNHQIDNIKWMVTKNKEINK